MLPQVLISNKNFIISRPKGRGRLKLYVHAEPLRDLIAQHSFTIIAEKERQKIILTPKLSFKNKAYGLYLAATCSLIWRLGKSKDDLLKSYDTQLEQALLLWGEKPYDDEMASEFFDFLAAQLK